MVKVNTDESVAGLSHCENCNVLAHAQNLTQYRLQTLCTSCACTIAQDDDMREREAWEKAAGERERAESIRAKARRGGV